MWWSAHPTKFWLSIQNNFSTLIKNTTTNAAFNHCSKSICYWYRIDKISLPQKKKLSTYVSQNPISHFYLSYLGPQVYWMYWLENEQFLHKYNRLSIKTNKSNSLMSNPFHESWSTGRRIVYHSFKKSYKFFSRLRIFFSMQRWFVRRFGDDLCYKLVSCYYPEIRHHWWALLKWFTQKCTTVG